MTMKTYRYPSVLTIAGFDGSGGAGIQADIKAISAIGCYATTVLTALPVQNTRGVRFIHSIPDYVVREQLETILDDIFPDAIKIGMVHSVELVDTIADTLSRYPSVPVVFDPVMVATSGDKLIEDRTIAAITERLLPLATVLTPNMDEAAILAGIPVRHVADMQQAGEQIRRSGCRSVLLKGGHLTGSRLTSLYFDETGQVHAYHFERFETNNTHGSGCTLSSAIAAYLALGESLLSAIQKGQTYVHRAIGAGADVQTGKGNGPLNHFFDPQPLRKK